MMTFRLLACAAALLLTAACTDESSPNAAGQGGSSGGDQGVGGGTPCVVIDLTGASFDAFNGKTVVALSQGTQPLSGFVSPVKQLIAGGAFSVSYARIEPGTAPLPPVVVFIDSDGDGACSASESAWELPGEPGNTCDINEKIALTPQAIGAGATPYTCTDGAAGMGGGGSHGGGMGGHGGTGSGGTTGHGGKGGMGDGGAGGTGGIGGHPGPGAGGAGGAQAGHANGGTGGGFPCVQIKVNGSGFDAHEGKKLVTSPQGKLPPGADVFETITVITSGTFSFEYVHIEPLDGPLPPLVAFIDDDANSMCGGSELAWEIPGQPTNACGVYPIIEITPAGVSTSDGGAGGSTVPISCGSAGAGGSGGSAGNAGAGGG